MSPLEVTLVAADAFTRIALQHMLADLRPEISLVDTLRSPRQMRMALAPDVKGVMLLDDALPPGETSLDLVKAIKQCHPALALVVLSDFVNEDYANSLFDAGADGFLYRGEMYVETLATAIKAVARGEPFISVRIVTLKYVTPRPAKLGDRERDMLWLLAQGQTTGAIMTHLKISQRTLYRIRNRLREYLNVSNNEQIIDAARRYGLLAEAPPSFPAFDDPEAQ